MRLSHLKLVSNENGPSRGELKRNSGTSQLMNDIGLEKAAEAAELIEPILERLNPFSALEDTLSFAWHIDGPVISYEKLSEQRATSFSGNASSRISGEAFPAETGLGASSSRTDLMSETDERFRSVGLETDLKILRLESKIDLIGTTLTGAVQNVDTKLVALNDKLDKQTERQLSDKNTLMGTVIAVGIAIAGLIVAMASYGASTFYNGTVTRDVLDQSVQKELKALIQGNSQGAPAKGSPTP